MANKIVVVYQHAKINNKWTFKKVPAMRRRFLSNGAYYISWYQGTTKRMELVGPDPGRPVVVVLSVEEYDRLKALQSTSPGPQAKNAGRLGKNDR